ncbi:hypothetical protein Syun_004336 [Stephania yunnanensis]|uniref:Uncharacterized protein n=1 Tax=Stephania yunnanensis TaxID=152371 RepID=A0AAP0Q2F6_9MAGN
MENFVDIEVRHGCNNSWLKIQEGNIHLSKVLEGLELEVDSIPAPKDSMTFKS